MDIGQAKHAVHFSEAWKFRRKSDEDFHDALFETLETLLTKAEPVQGEQDWKRKLAQYSWVAQICHTMMP